MSDTKTIICDIDGCILKHHEEGLSGQILKKPEVLPGVLDKFREWDQKRYNIILLTGRRECMRRQTEDELHSFGVFYDQLIMGVGGAPRVLINDLKPNGTETATGINIKRNEGLENVKV